MSPVIRRQSVCPGRAGAGGGTAEGIDVRSVPLVPAGDPARAGGDAPSFVTDDDLAEIAARCRLKAEGARRAAARQRRIREGGDPQAEVAPEDPEIVACADQLADHFYWMNSPPSQPADISLLDDVGGCFEAVAAAIALVIDNGTVRPGRLEQSLPLLAEAQSALRAAIQGIHAPDDPDQLQVFEWLKRTAAQHHVYIKRHMRADDPADPTRWRDLLDRIERVDARFQQTRRRSQKEGAWIDRVRRHLDLAGKVRPTERDWQALIKTIDEMVGEGIAPSNSEIRELLLPVIDELPDRDELPHGFRLVLREIDRFLATRTASSGAAISSRTNRRGQGGAAVVGGSQCRADRGNLPPGIAEVAENDVGSEGADLDRDQGTPVDRGVRVPHRPARRRPGPPGHPLVEPCVWGRETVLRPLRQAPGPASRGLQPEPGRRPDPFAVQQPTWRWVMIRPLRPHPARLPSSRSVP